MIQFVNIQKKYKDKDILKGVNFEIRDGEFVVLVGPSGSGKTTLLKMINRLVEPTGGDILMDGKDIRDLNLRRLRLEIGYVLQQNALFPNMTVEENILLVPEMKKWPRKQSLERAESLLTKVGLAPEEYLSRYPGELSGGEQQRVGILRAMIAGPRIMLMDEPFSALDALTRKQLQELTKGLQREFGMTTVFVTHDTDEALALADRIAVLYEGNIVQEASPRDIVNHAADDFVTDLFGGGSHE